MVINIPYWTTSKEEADKLVDELSEACFEYGKNENNEKLLDVFYATKALKNYVGIMQGRMDTGGAGMNRPSYKELLSDERKDREEQLRWIKDAVNGSAKFYREPPYSYEEELAREIMQLHTRIAELEAENEKIDYFFKKLRWYCIFAHWDNPNTEAEFYKVDAEIREYLSEYKVCIDQLTAHDAIERQDDKWTPEVQE